MNYWTIPAIDRERKPDRVINRVCDHFEITKIQLRSKSRIRKFVMAREVIMYVLDQTTKLSDYDIGKLVNRHRTNVIANRIKINKYLEVDNEYKELINKFI
jgi:chromosomal replication initiator protein